MTPSNAEVERRINEKIAALNQIRDIFKNGEMVELLRELLLGGDNSGSPLAHNASALGGKVGGALTHLRPDRLGASFGAVRGSLSQASDDFFREKAIGFRFTTHDFANFIGQLGLQTGRSARVSAATVLRRLVARGRVRVVQEGEGRRPNLYERLK